MKYLSFYIRIIFIAIVAVSISGCRSSKKVIQNQDSEKVHDISSKLSGTKKKIVDEAATWIGTPYAYAKADKKEGTDCSGMVMKVFEDALGCKIPRNSAKQAEFCEPVKTKDVESGDLVFFATGKDPNKISHVGIMLDTEQFIHSSSSKGVVVTPISSPYFSSRFIMFGRIPYKK